MDRDKCTLQQYQEYIKVTIWNAQFVTAQDDSQTKTSFLIPAQPAESQSWLMKNGAKSTGKLKILIPQN